MNVACGFGKRYAEEAGRIGVGGRAGAFASEHATGGGAA